MQAVLTQLNSVPGVIGSLACDVEGRVLVQAFPPLFDTALLEDASRVLADGAVGLEFGAGDVELVDFRFGDARLSVKPLQEAMLLVLSSGTANPQFLNLSISVAAGKLAKLRQVPAPPPEAVTEALEAEALPADVPARHEKRAAEADAFCDTPALPANAVARHEKRVAAPTKGLEELRRRLAGARGPSQEKPGSDSVTAPIRSRGER